MYKHGRNDMRDTVLVLNTIIFLVLVWWQMIYRKFVLVLFKEEWEDETYKQNAMEPRVTFLIMQSLVIVFGPIW